MNAGKMFPGRFLKFVIYLVVVVLVNLAGMTLFFRLDLTRNKIYSISKASQNVVATLSEPLTIKVFFSKNLPAPHNNTERYLQDLLEEYGNYANRFFNYRFYNVTADSGDITPEAKENQELAGNYGINPVQIQAVEKDEVKFLKAYMGLVIIHGDLIERIPTITSTDGLEYRLTTAIQKLNNKVSALAGLDDKIRVRLYMSSSLEKVAPLLNLDDLPNVPQIVGDAVQKLNSKAYGKLTFQHIDPSKDPGASADEIKKHNIITLKWPDLPQKNLAAGSGSIGLVMAYKDKSLSIPILHVIRLPIIGTQYEMTNLDRMEDTLEASIESLIDINENIGVLAGFGAVPVSAEPPQQAMMQEDLDSASTLYDLLSKSYSVKNVSLSEGGIPEGIRCLIIPGPTEKLTDYDLYQIDQYLMKGNSLALFLETFKEVMPQNQQGLRLNNQGPVYLPVQSGLEKLLNHYGVRINTSYVMDENCFKQKLPAQLGGGERPIYFAPLIKKKNISESLDVIKNIKGLVTVKASPVFLDEEAVKKSGVSAHRLFASSDDSWEMKGRINLNPMFIQPPQSAEDKKSFPLAYLIEGPFESYFKGKPIPEKVTKADKEKAEKSGQEGADAEEKKAVEPDPELAEIHSEGLFIPKGKPGKLLVVGSAEMIKNNIMDKDGRSPNDMFVLNLIDYLNGNEDIAVMRSKEQRFNPLDDVGPATKTFIKSFNIVGLPILVILFGLLVWMRRHARKGRIQMIFK
ncbi:MAG: Gldg family protein [Deltaproteobacteria bacterium]